MFVDKHPLNKISEILKNIEVVMTILDGKIAYTKNCD